MRRCPICRKSVIPDREQNPALPFCSQRCRMIDLGNWLGGEYVLSRGIDPEEDYEAIEEAMRTMAAQEVDG